MSRLIGKVDGAETGDAIARASSPTRPSWMGAVSQPLARFMTKPGRMGSDVRDRGRSPSRTPAWYAWWIGLASGEVRREAMVSTRHNIVYQYRDFDAPFEIAPPVIPTPVATPAAETTSTATPATGDQAEVS